MTIRRWCIGLASASIFVMSIWLLSSVPQAMAETLSSQGFVHVTKAEMIPIADVEGHAITLGVREGATRFENGDWAWVKATSTGDFIKGAGPFDQYTTFRFLDGSTLTVHTKGMVEATPQGVASAAKWAGDIIHGTGRFQGIKGTVTTSGKMLPPEKGEPVGKSFVESTFVYTLPSK
jgi:hypothetical protein